MAVSAEASGHDIVFAGIAGFGKGRRVSEAARVLGLKPHTVAGYVKNLYRKLNISSRAEAVIEALRRGLV